MRVKAPGVLNLSTTFQLTEVQASLLSKGLSYVPIFNLDTNNKRELGWGLARYHRRLKLACKFSNKTDRRPRLPFILPSSWEPLDSDLPRALLDLIERDSSSLHFAPRIPDKNNLSEEEWEALLSLANNATLVIKASDKGSCVVLLDRTLYVAEAMRQLCNPNHYRAIAQPLYPETAAMVERIVRDLEARHFIKEKQLLFFLDNDPPKPRTFYLLPKIHKPIDSWPHPNCPAGRPIVSDCGSETYNIGPYIDSFLQPLSTKHPSYLKDTPDFLTKIRKITLAATDKIFTCDVVSLYTNIMTDSGLEAIRDCFVRYPDPSRPDEQLLELLEICLTRNDFVFNGLTFLQTRGTSMGRSWAPSYANIYMASWEKTAFSKCPLLPSHYYRYLDDIWGIWPHSEKDFQDWINTLNAHHPTISLEATIHNSSVNFLDTTVFKGDKFLTTLKLDSRVYFKPTDTHALLHKNSFHPPHTFKGIVKSQLIRFDRICTQERDRMEATRILFRVLRRRGYTKTFLRNVYNKWKKVRRRHRDPKDPEKTKIIPIITKYSQFATSIHVILKKHLENARPGLPDLSGHRVLSAFCRHPNLKDHLVSSKLPPLDTKRPGLGRACVLSNPTTGKQYKIPRLPLSVSNCVYAIRCSKCNKLYVGETGGTVAHRGSTHRYTIARGTEKTLLSLHFRRHGLKCFRIYPLDRNIDWSTRARRFNERLWIRRLDTMSPIGLNMRWDGH